MFTTKAKKTEFVILISLLIINLLFIWGNSLPDKASSKKSSTEIVEIVKPILEPVVGSGNVTDHLVRKLAHFAEFYSLGVILTLLLIVRDKVRLQPILNILYFGFFVALTDETIQLFTGRGSQVQDIWLDFIGFVTGIGFILLIFLLAKFLPQH